MKKYLTKDDLLDVYIKGKQRGFDFILSKFQLKGSKRTVSAFNESAKSSANWWDIPYVRERWNKKISGNATKDHNSFLVEDILKGQKNLCVLSLGSGESTHEMKLAKSSIFKNITCLDLSDYRMTEARKTADSRGIKNMEFICANIYEHDFGATKYDYVLFNASLHHFDEIKSFIPQKIIPILKENGGLIMNEYVGATRLQFDKEQIKAVNKALKIVPKKYKKRFKTKLYKNNFSGSGVWRMIMADPSECVDSKMIMPTLHQYFNTQIEKPYGGNILANALKDIAHHFYELNDEKKQVLDELFAFEDEYLKNSDSDFVFGVYQLKK